jgi:hypothetical protein
MVQFDLYISPLLHSFHSIVSTPIKFLKEHLTGIHFPTMVSFDWLLYACPFRFRNLQGVGTKTFSQSE